MARFLSALKDIGELYMQQQNITYPNASKLFANITICCGTDPAVILLSFQQSPAENLRVYWPHNSSCNDIY